MENENTIYVSDSKNGKGLFSGRLIKSGEKIIEFHGPKKRMQDLPNPYSAVDDHYVQTGYI
ncbi:hypothetical protein A2673_01055 [Candidatus Kaiserbacteria bacterium RIFCSPHIGHO2_01_FULL_50_13]|uniref:SET domain-containing protein n=1 Tax=Candidatus Kaiserbacteria bacterium RIFCSPLOWO2_01_FULL_50_24 TaxID=1798507 RepID=A0A1F6EMU5_9BACT|nr:MAG: hypothetical protein A2673_01055 [Candidatus Kaiserbacteria bacterium RIFCSPHIGHO2_01_FULL_50_13]OGG74935.1 MAG: hypothetical protein A3A34_03915 [Candidatus Kaiserbacteria bacterium RIFCSPLOWO2_01_FULL_50_24]OGG81737.1 MAG: hypothetical protein A3H74_00990 [Candidatus Kaiserbacteria bacterium RIFCSPLOWO2_02_FULL_51_13]